MYQIMKTLIESGGFAQQAQGAGTEPPDGGADDEEGDEQ